MRLSKRLDLLPQADIRAMTRECERIGGFNLSQGVCDLPTPKEILQAASDAILKDQSVYAPANGIPELREKIAEKVQRENGISAKSENIVVTNGVTGGFASLLTALLDPGDGVILVEPYYGYHYAECIVTHCVPQVARHGENFSLSVSELEKVRDDKTRAIVICTPGNPSGRMYSEDELSGVLRFAKENNLIVIADEIYEYFRYDGRSHLSMASLPGAEDRVVTMMGFSKTYSITGWRLGYLVCPDWMLSAVSKTNDLFYVCAPTPLQWGVLAGFSQVSDDYYESLISDFGDKRNRFCAALEEAGLKPVVPEGSYYVLADVTSMECANSIEASADILKKARVASVPGQAFFQSEDRDRFVRFCFAVEDEILDGAIQSLKKLRGE